MRWIDVSIPLQPDVTVWPGDTAFTLRPVARMDEGDECNLTAMTMSIHTGTHVDAPWHFMDAGRRMDEIDTGLLFGGATVLDASGEAEVISAEFLESRPLSARVLIKTRNSRLPVQGPFHADYVALEEKAAQTLVRGGVRLVGVDYLSVAPFGDQAPVHEFLLSNGVVVVEGLRLGHMPAGPCQFVVLPLPLVGVEAAPGRAFVGYEEKEA